MVLATHFTQVKCGITTALEILHFQRPDRTDFRLVCGPVPHLVESFLVTPSDAGTELRWQGELGRDLWAIGRMVGPGGPNMDRRRPDNTARPHRRSRTPRTDRTDSSRAEATDARTGAFGFAGGTESTSDG